MAHGSYSVATYLRQRISHDVTLPSSPITRICAHPRANVHMLVSANAFTPTRFGKSVYACARLGTIGTYIASDMSIRGWRSIVMFALRHDVHAQALADGRQLRRVAEKRGLRASIMLEPHALDHMAMRQCHVVRRHGACLDECFMSLNGHTWTY